jgi:sugar lactone lactonase YvrE
MKRIICVLFFLLCCVLSALGGFAQSGIVTIRTVAGSGAIGSGGDGGIATSAQVLPFDGDGNTSAGGVAVDSAGNVYIGDAGNDRVRRVTAGGLIYTVSSSLFYPIGIAVDPAGNLFIADTGNSRVLKVTVDGVVRIVAGNGRLGYSGDGGQATSASLNAPTGIAVDAAGNLYIADLFNNRVRKVTTDGVIRAVAGSGIPGFAGDGGPAASALLNNPYGVAVDASGSLYIADRGNNCIRKVAADGSISTIAGNGTFGFSGDGGPAFSAQLNSPIGVALDAAGNIFIADTGNDRVREIASDGVIRTVAGNGAFGFSGDGGPATSAKIGYIAGIAVDSAGNLFIADTDNHRVRKVSVNPPVSSDPAAVRRDFNGDRKSDILLRNAEGNVSMLLMDGYTTTKDISIANIWNGWTIAGSGDFNGDGKSDVLWRDIAGNTAIWIMDGATLISYSSIANMPVTWAVSGVADFDADGKADILWRDAAGNVLIWLMDGSRIANYSFVANIWNGWTISGTGDFNGDAKADILWRDTAGNIAIWLMDGTNVSSYTSIGNVSPSWTNASIADFDGDGKSDILWRNIDGQVSMWLMNGDTINASVNVANISTDWSIVGNGDFNGDGKADILWRDTAGNAAIWLMDGPVISNYSGVGNLSDRMVQ